MAGTPARKAARVGAGQQDHGGILLSPATGKILGFSLFKRGSKIYAVVFANAKATTLLSILKERIVPDSIVYHDSLPNYNALDVWGFRHLRKFVYCVSEPPVPIF